MNTFSESADSYLIAYVTDSPGEYDEHTEILDCSEIAVSSLGKYDLIVLKEHPMLREAVTKIRSSDDPSVYLKPLVIHRGSHHSYSPYITELIDGTFRDEHPRQFYLNNRHRIESINAKIREIYVNSYEPSITDAAIALKIIRFLYSRDMLLKPVLSPDSILGYTYPYIDLHFKESGHQQYMILDFLENRYLVQGEFVDKIHICNSCYAGFLNFREICTSCGSPDIVIQDLIHHFVCAYMGPESDFKQQEAMICPKCKKGLRHIGVDYDRPSSIYQCRQCEHSFQDPNVDVLCINCGKQTLPEHLILRSIKKYRLTTMGKNSAMFGIVISIRDALKVNLEILDMEIFKIFLRLEIERIQRYRISQSTLGVLTIQDFMNVFSGMGVKAKEVSREISDEIKRIIRNTDIISSLSDSALVFLFIETSAENSEIVMKRLTEKISDLLMTNFKIKITFKTRCWPVNGQSSAESLIREVVKNA